MEKKKDLDFSPEMDLFKMAEKMKAEQGIVKKEPEGPTKEQIKYRKWRKDKKRQTKAAQRANRNKKKHRKKKGRVKADGR